MKATAPRTGLRDHLDEDRASSGTPSGGPGDGRDRGRPAARLRAYRWSRRSWSGRVWRSVGSITVRGRAPAGRPSSAGAAASDQPHRAGRRRTSRLARDDPGKTGCPRLRRADAAIARSAAARGRPAPTLTQHATPARNGKSRCRPGETSRQARPCWRRNEQETGTRASLFCAGGYRHGGIIIRWIILASTFADPAHPVVAVRPQSSPDKASARTGVAAR